MDNFLQWCVILDWALTIEADMRRRAKKPYYDDKSYMDKGRWTWPFEIDVAVLHGEVERMAARKSVNEMSKNQAGFLPSLPHIPQFTTYNVGETVMRQLLELGLVVRVWLIIIIYLILLGVSFDFFLRFPFYLNQIPSLLLFSCTIYAF